MSSINTNVAAMTALQSLQATNGELQKTQNRISTGLRVASAADNAAYWSIATTMRSDKQALSTVTDALGLGSATWISPARVSKTAIDITSQIKSKLVAARSPGVDREKIQAEIEQLQQSLQGTVDGASFSGQNWLKVDSTGTTSRSLVSSFQRDASNNLSVGRYDLGRYRRQRHDADRCFGQRSGILDQSRSVTSGRHLLGARSRHLEPFGLGCRSRRSRRHDPGHRWGDLVDDDRRRRALAPSRRASICRRISLPR